MMPPIHAQSITSRTAFKHKETANAPQRQLYFLCIGGHSNRYINDPVAIKPPFISNSRQSLLNSIWSHFNFFSDIQLKMIRCIKNINYQTRNSTPCSQSYRKKNNIKRLGQTEIYTPLNSRSAYVAEIESSSCRNRPSLCCPHKLGRFICAYGCMRNSFFVK